MQYAVSHFNRYMNAIFYRWIILKTHLILSKNLALLNKIENKTIRCSFEYYRIPFKNSKQKTFALAVWNLSHHTVFVDKRIETQLKCTSIVQSQQNSTQFCCHCYVFCQTIPASTPISRNDFSRMELFSVLNDIGEHKDIVCAVFITKEEENIFLPLLIAFQL